VWRIVDNDPEGGLNCSPIETRSMSTEFTTFDAFPILHPRPTILFLTLDLSNRLTFGPTNESAPAVPTPGVGGPVGRLPAACWRSCSSFNAYDHTDDFEKKKKPLDKLDQTLSKKIVLEPGRRMLVYLRLR
jgi:hypothetical protein